MRLLDLFCGAGGCAVGYHRAGFTEIVGVDVKPQPRYPFEFVQGDAMELLDYLASGVPFRTEGGAKFYAADFDAIHASPPCQAYTSMRHMGKTAGDNASELVHPVRDLLRKAGRPWVIENVPGSPLESPVVLCGSMFGLRVRRHRLFESSEFLFGNSCRHDRQRPIAVYGDHPQQPGIGTVNRARTLSEGQHAMGIDWMEWRELTQAIPPAYTEFIGKQLIDAIGGKR